MEDATPPWGDVALDTMSTERAWDEARRGCQSSTHSRLGMMHNKGSYVPNPARSWVYGAVDVNPPRTPASA